MDLSISYFKGLPVRISIKLHISVYEDSFYQNILIWHFPGSSYQCSPKQLFMVSRMKMVFNKRKIQPNNQNMHDILDLGGELKQHYHVHSKILFYQ